MVIGAIPQIGIDVLFIGEMLLSDPGNTFTAHLGEFRGIAVHPGDHIVTADSGDGSAAVRHHG